MEEGRRMYEWGDWHLLQGSLNRAEKQGMCFRPLSQTDPQTTPVSLHEVGGSSGPHKKASPLRPLCSPTQPGHSFFIVVSLRKPLSLLVPTPLPALLSFIFSLPGKSQASFVKFPLLSSESSVEALALTLSKNDLFWIIPTLITSEAGGVEPNDTTVLWLKAFY